MPTLAALLQQLDEIAPPAKAGGWDPVGLQLGDPARECVRIGVAHEVTDAVVDAAIAASLDLLIAYHPLLFRPTTRLVAGTGPSGRAFRLVAGGVALGVVHTAFDVVPGGVADALGEALGLDGMVPFGPNWGSEAVKIVTFVTAADAGAVAAAMSAAGAGVIGKYTGCSFRSEGIGTFVAGAGTQPVTGRTDAANAEPETRIEMIAPQRARDRVVAALVAAHPYEEPAYDVFAVQANAGFIGRVGDLPAPMTLSDLAAHVGQVLGSDPRMSGDRQVEVRRVAVVPGSGRSFLGHARGADVLVTGDIGHHDARQAAEAGLAVIDPGHAATERPGLRRLYAAVAQIAADVVDLTGVDADPWQP